MFVMLKWNVHEFILNLKQAENDEKTLKGVQDMMQ